MMKTNISTEPLKNERQFIEGLPCNPLSQIPSFHDGPNRLGQNYAGRKRANSIVELIMRTGNCIKRYVFHPISQHMKAITTANAKLVHQTLARSRFPCDGNGIRWVTTKTINGQLPARQKITHNAIGGLLPPRAARYSLTVIVYTSPVPRRSRSLAVA